MRATEQLSRFVVETSFEDLPLETIEWAKQLLLKCVASMLVGSQEPVGRKITRYVRELGGIPEAGVIGGGFRVPAENSALALGTFAHAPELEDDSFPGSASTVQIVPVVLSLGQKLKSSGREILESFVLGYEVQGRMAMAFDPRTSELGICPLPYHGVLGSAAAAAKMLGLDVMQTRMALSLAASQSAGLLSQAGTMAHLLETGMTCRGGVMAAMLAQQGVLGNPEPIENGIVRMHGQGGCDLVKLTKDLGKPFFIHQVWMKKYPCCFLTHRQTDAMLMLIKEHNISYDDIDSVEVEVGGTEAGVCNRPEPRDAQDSKFSWPHALAGVMLEGKLDIDSFTNEKVLEPKFKEARSKVKVTVRPEWTRLMSENAPLAITLKNGKKLTKNLRVSIGGPGNHLTDEGVVALFKQYACLVLSDAQMDRTIELVLSLNKTSNDILELMDILTFRHRV